MYPSQCLITLEWLYHATIYPPSVSGSTRLIISCHDLSTPVSFYGSDYIMSRYIHPHPLVPWEWLYHVMAYPPPLSSSMGVTISWYDICTPLPNSMGLIALWRSISTDSILWEGGGGVIISWHYIFTPDNIWWGGDYIVTSHFHS